MALRDYTPAKRAVTYKGKTLVEVRGLSLEDVAILMRNHIVDLRSAYDMWSGEFRKLLPVSPAEIDNLIIGFITMFPTTAHRMIALASDEEDAEEHARRLPLPLQIKALVEIIEQTFEDVGGPLVFAAAMRMKFLAIAPEAANIPSSGSTVN